MLYAPLALPQAQHIANGAYIQPASVMQKIKDSSKKLLMLYDSCAISKVKLEKSVAILHRAITIET
jgi:hypothetical protein